MSQVRKMVSPERDLIYDVGMHKGEDTEYYLKKGFRVVAFEANPDLVEENKERFSQALKEKKLVIVEGAIVDNISSKKTLFYKNLNSTVWGTINPDWALRNEKLGTHNQEIEVNTVDFGRCLEVHGMPYYMKIDIEGADEICLKALTQFEIKPSYLSIESEMGVFEKLIHEFDLLIELGYVKFQAIQQMDIYKTKLPYPSKEGENVSHAFIPDSSGLFGRDLPDNWKTREEILKEYEKIFLRNRRYGESTWWRQTKFGLILSYLISKIIGKPFPGWYDTHAKLSVS
jgi:FkbM family methyltransferase